MTAAVAIFLFFPYTHVTNSNIVVGFFTDRMAPRGKRVLDIAHDVIFIAVAALLAWRLSIGFADKIHTGESTMLVRIPYWWSFGFAVASMILLGIVCIARIYAGVRTLRQ
jgi:TRAP-type C4-dicarboxylate transport system permease small subunit